MRDGRLPSRAAAALLGVVLGAPAAGARRAPETLTPDQVIVVAAAVHDSFPLPRRGDGPMVLCLDVRLSDLALDAEPPPEPTRRRGRAPAKAATPEPTISGAPPELVARLARPWRTVVSALSCRLDPRQPLTLNDDRTLAQLVTVHMTAHVAAGPIKIDWTSPGSSSPVALTSRDCAATRGPRGWSVRCGGTWTQ